MRQILVVLAVFGCFERCHAATSCKTVFCPKQTGKSISCDMCHTCLDVGARFCFTPDHKNCQCATIVPETCELQAGSGTNYTFCHLLDDISLPPPEVLAHDEHSVSAVVPRFFQEPPFDTQKPSFLYLLASFNKNGSECSSIGHIEAYERNGDKCLLRVRVQMPRIDYTGKENYYYDDRSALESQFSRDIFGPSAQNVTFWTEVTIRRDERLRGGGGAAVTGNVTTTTNGTTPHRLLSFATVLKSARIEFEL